VCFHYHGQVFRVHVIHHVVFRATPATCSPGLSQPTAVYKIESYRPQQSTAMTSRLFSKSALNSVSLRLNTSSARVRSRYIKSADQQARSARDDYRHRREQCLTPLTGLRVIRDFPGSRKVLPSLACAKSCSRLSGMTTKESSSTRASDNLALLISGPSPRAPG